MKLARPLVLAAGAAALLTGFSASAMSPSAYARTVTVTDAAGDANAINDQGFGAGPAGTATPGSQAALDIVKATLADTGKTAKVKGKSTFTCTGFTLTIEMGGPINSSVPAIYRLLGHTTANDNIFQLYFNNGIAAKATEVRYGAGSADDTVALTNPAVVSGNKLTVTVTAADIKGFGDKLGDEITDFVIEDSISSGATFVPQVDQLVTDKTFKMC